VNEEHVREIFGLYGRVANVELVTGKHVKIPKVRHCCGRIVLVVWGSVSHPRCVWQGTAYVEFFKRKDAQEALLHLHDVRGVALALLLAQADRIIRCASPAGPA